MDGLTLKGDRIVRAPSPIPQLALLLAAVETRKKKVSLPPPTDQSIRRLLIYSWASSVFLPRPSICGLRVCSTPTKNRLPWMFVFLLPSKQGKRRRKGTKNIPILQDPFRFMDAYFKASQGKVSCLTRRGKQRNWILNPGKSFALSSLVCRSCWLC